MENKNNKIKGLTVSTLSGLMALGTLGMPVSVLAEGADEVAESGTLERGGVKGFKFVYKKQHTKEDRKPSIYGLRLVTGLTNEGKPFKVTKEQVKQASLNFAVDRGQGKSAEVTYNGLYELIGLQREPGFYPVMTENMHKEGDEGLFQFPTIRGMDEADVYTHTQSVEMKESEFLENLEVVLQNEKRFGLVGDFSLERIAEPTKVYGKFTEEELDTTFQAIEENYNTPDTKELANTVKTWGKLDEVVKIADLTTKNKADKVIGEDLKETELKFASKLTEDLTEGIYRLKQKTTDKGYTIRPEIIFALTIDSNGEEPIIKFIKADDGKFSEQLDEFGELQIHENEQFKYGDAGKGEENSIYQALLVNFTKPGYIPVDPNDPDPEDPYNPSKHGFNKFVSRKAKINEELEDKADAIVEESRGDHIKVNIGEVFAFDFDVYLPGNIAEYKRFEFQDFFDEAIDIQDVSVNSDYRKSVKVRSGEEDITSEVVDRFIKEGQDLRIVFNPKALGEYANTSINIEIDDVFLKKGTIENITNRGYLHYKIGENETPEVKPGNPPEDKDIIIPGDPTDPDNPKYPEDPNNPTDPTDPTKPVDPNDPDVPSIPTTPEVIIDPLNVDFRMGVVNQGTTILDEAEYRITSFKPTRGRGGINEDGNLYVGRVEFDINRHIDTTGIGFVKLQDLPAGRYIIEETVAPVKGDDEYRLVIGRLEVVVHEDEKTVTISSPIVKRGGEVTANKTIDVEKLYRTEDGKRNEANWNNHEEVLDGEAMLHHYKYINAPATGTLAQIPFFLGGGVAVSAGLVIGKKKKEDK